MQVEFKTESEATSFMMFLADQNNQGHKQILYTPVGMTSVEYSFNDVIHDDLYKKVQDYLNSDTKKTLTIMCDPSNDNFYIAEYESEEAHELAFKQDVKEAEREALAVWGLQEDEVNIEVL